ncbi:MAG TPA: LptA/OstA family protein, partial [Thermoanaerobaculia bacterium]|nr:LptA/OstA family protein [Thermoanaerobaculia bacterium]
AVLISDRGELRAPKISYARGTGIAHATGGVEATLQREEGGAWRQTPLAAGDEPVRVEAREGYWQERPRTFLFRGGVRAWSGERLLLADQLRGDVDRDELAAAGGVETLWFVPPRQGAGGDPRPLRLTADTLIYDQKGDLLTYSGGVVVVDAERRLSCDELRVQLTGDGEAERMTCTGSVALSAPEEGRTVKAERAEYDLASERLVFHGEPVEVQDGKGGRLHGRRVTYHMDSGKVSVSGQDRDGQAAGQGGGRPAPAGGSR